MLAKSAQTGFTEFCQSFTFEVPNLSVYTSMICSVPGVNAYKLRLCMASELLNLYKSEGKKKARLKKKNKVVIAKIFFPII